MGDAATDEDLLAAIARGDQQALNALYRRHAPWVMARLAQRCNDPEVVDVALQDTFVAVWRKPASYEGRGEVAAWLWGIAVRRLIDQLRRRPRHTPLAAADAPVVSAEEEVLIGLQHGGLISALDSLSPELVAVVQATVLDGLTTSEAAHLLRIPAGTVKSRMSRARVQLREALT